MSRSRLRIALSAVLGALVLAALPAHAAPADGPPPGVATVLQDDAVFLHGTDDEIKTAVAQAHDLGFDRVRLTAGWSVIAPQPDSPTKPDFDASDPAAYPAGAWDNLDRAVRLVTAGGLKPMIDIAFWAPRWATQSDPSETQRLRTEIDPQDYAQFAAAVAKRYAGGYVPPAKVTAPPAGPSPDANFLEKLFGRQPAPAKPAAAPAPDPLPGVDLFTVWNEPNHPGFLMPQWTRVNGQWVPRSPAIYRAMLMAAYPAIKAAAPNSRVLIGGTASMGSSTPGKSGVPPLKFLKALACVDDDFKPIRTGDCANFTTLPGDGWAHHPYSLRTLPDAQPKDPDKLPVASTPRLSAALARLVDEHRLAPGDRDIYMTEYGYETSPPDPQAKFSPQEQPRLLAWAEYIATRDPHVKMWPQFLLKDRPGDPAGPQGRAFGDWQTGLLYADGTPKPSFAAWKAPAFATCVRSHGKPVALVWGRLRDAAHPATAIVESVAKGASAWIPQRSASTPKAGAVMARTASVSAPNLGVKRYVTYQPGARYRVRWAGQTAADSPALTPLSCRGTNGGGATPHSSVSGNRAVRSAGGAN